MHALIWNKQWKFSLLQGVSDQQSGLPYKINLCSVVVFIFVSLVFIGCSIYIYIFFSLKGLKITGFLGIRSTDSYSERLRYKEVCVEILADVP